MTSPRHVDVLIVGAGLSGIGAAYWLQTECPSESWTILEGRSNLGGTWDLFRYPGIRSDSDMHTLGYSFKPWTDAKAIADGPSILEYVQETADEFGISDNINYDHQVKRADWDSDAGQWTVTAAVGPDAHESQFTCKFLFMCAGYYSYKGGHKPDFVDQDKFAGPIIHPQEWPEDLDYTNKRVVIIGSGATAVTLVPAMADTAAHVTMLQRSPTWMVSRPAVDPVNKVLQFVLPETTAFKITRRINTARNEAFYWITRKQPKLVRKVMLTMNRFEVGKEQVDANFTPTYDPWDQRVCLLPDGDLFDTINEGEAEIVTDTIEAFTETGIRLTSGAHLDADIIVTATGLSLVTAGDMDFYVDGETVDFGETWTYRGIGFSGIPNLASTFGYINASWTLRADLVSQFVCRILNHMRETGTTVATPQLRPSDRSMTPKPYIDDFSSGYMARMMPMLPKQGDREPWTNPQSYTSDKKTLLATTLDDGALVLSSVSQRQPA